MNSPAVFKATRWVVLLTFCALTLACGHRKVRYEAPADNKAPVSIWAGWVKPKKSIKYDMELHLRNNTDKAVIVMKGDLNCAMGAVKGRLTKLDETVISLPPHQERQFNNVLCTLPTKASGNYKLTVLRVYDNPTQDGYTYGKVISQNIEWIGGTEAADSDE